VRARIIDSDAMPASNRSFGPSEDYFDVVQLLSSRRSWHGSRGQWVHRLLAMPASHDADEIELDIADLRRRHRA
jgi:hypothetical protein